MYRRRHGGVTWRRRSVGLHSWRFFFRGEGVHERDEATGGNGYRSVFITTLAQFSKLVTCPLNHTVMHALTAFFCCVIPPRLFLCTRTFELSSGQLPTMCFYLSRKSRLIRRGNAHEHEGTRLPTIFQSSLTFDVRLLFRQWRKWINVWVVQ